MKREINIYTDGGCSGNPGPGGWAFVVLDGNDIKKFSSGVEKTTNNQMELCAATKALQYVKDNVEFNDAKITLYIDSQYVKSGITTWINMWKNRGWKTAEKKPVKNKELWLKLDELNSCLTIDWQWVKGHDGIKYNEICDKLCKNEIQKIKNNSNN